MSLSINATTFIPSLIPLPSSPREDLELRDRHNHVLEADIELLESHIEHMSSTLPDITPSILLALSGKILDKVQILNCIKDLYPTLTTSDINSKLYSLKNKRMVHQIRGKTSRPLWALC